MEIRRRNLVPTDAMPWKTPCLAVYDSGNFVRNMDIALERADWAGFPARRKESEARGKLRGIGLALYLAAAGAGTFNLTAGTLEAKSIDYGASAPTGSGTATRAFNFTSGTLRNYAGSDLAIANVPLNLTGSGTRVFEATSGQAITTAVSARALITRGHSNLTSAPQRFLCAK